MRKVGREVDSTRSVRILYGISPFCMVERLGDVTPRLTSTGTERFEEILRHWLGVVSKSGPAMILIRSRGGP